MSKHIRLLENEVIIKITKDTITRYVRLNGTLFTRTARRVQNNKCLNVWRDTKKGDFEDDIRKEWPEMETDPAYDDLINALIFDSEIADELKKLDNA